MWHDDSEYFKPWMNGGSERQTARKQCGGNMPQCGMPLQISNCYKWLKGALRVSNDAPLSDHVNEELRNNGQWGEYNISRPSDGDCDGHVRERSPPWLNEGNMPQYKIWCQSHEVNNQHLSTILVLLHKQNLIKGRRICPSVMSAVKVMR